MNFTKKLLTNPPIIFCDEPTTGLDSFNAQKVVEALKYLSSRSSDVSSDESNATNGHENRIEISSKSKMLDKMSPKAVICSIHQPTSDIFQCFSEIILMHAGRCVFQGKTEDAFEFFSRFVLSSAPKRRNIIISCE